ncbi:MAG: hypothetical protein AB7P02_07450 [Alphaproteobacteria bacterium]
MRAHLLASIAALGWLASGTTSAAEIITHLRLFNTSGSPGTATVDVGIGEQTVELPATQLNWFATAVFSGLSGSGMVGQSTDYFLEFRFGAERCKVVVRSTISPAPGCAIYSQEFSYPARCSAMIAMAPEPPVCGMTLSVKP